MFGLPTSGSRRNWEYEFIDVHPEDGWALGILVALAELTLTVWPKGWKNIQFYGWPNRWVAGDEKIGGKAGWRRLDLSRLTSRSRKKCWDVKVKTTTARPIDSFVVMGWKLTSVAASFSRLIRPYPSGCNKLIPPLLPGSVINWTAQNSEIGKKHRGIGPNGRDGWQGLMELLTSVDFWEQWLAFAEEREADKKVTLPPVLIAGVEVW
jgi:hypothetical protein